MNNNNAEKNFPIQGEEGERALFDHVLHLINGADVCQLRDLIDLSTSCLETSSDNAHYYIYYSESICKILDELGVQKLCVLRHMFYLEGHGFNEEMLKMLNKTARQVLLAQGPSDSGVDNYFEREKTQKKSVFGKILESLKIK